jgi:hypothetical protein
MDLGDPSEFWHVTKKRLNSAVMLGSLWCIYRIGKSLGGGKGGGRRRRNERGRMEGGRRKEKGGGFFVIYHLQVEQES